MYVAVNVAVRPILLDQSVSENSSFGTGLGCKRSLVQIQSRRPIYLAVFTGESSENRSYLEYHISAHTCSKKQTNAGVGGGKIGVRPHLHLVRSHLALKEPSTSISSLSSAATENNLSAHNWTSTWGGASWSIMFI